MSIPNVYYEGWLKSIPSLEGKTIAITGTTSGTGYWAAVCAIRKQAGTLLLLNRASERSEKSLKNLEREKEDCESMTELIAIDCDLQSFKSVKEAAAKINDIAKEKKGLDVLANNAGIMAFPDDRTGDGYEVQMQTNHLSHFLLTKLLIPSLLLAGENGREARICQHSSGARLIGGDLDAKFFRKGEPGTLGGNSPLSKVNRYHMTKLANTTFAMKLHQMLIDQGMDVQKIKSVVAEPGVCETGLATSMFGAIDGWFAEKFSRGILFIFRLMNGFERQSGADGALPLIEACFGENVDSGDFFYPEKKKVGNPFKAISKGKLVDGASPELLTLSEANQELVWKSTEEELGSIFEIVV